MGQYQERKFQTMENPIDDEQKKLKERRSKEKKKFITYI
jgi:hypothetical protein